MQDPGEPPVADFTYNPGLVLGFVAARTGTDEADFHPCTTLGITEGGMLVAGVVYNNYHELPRGRWIELTVAAERRPWLTRKTIRAILGYPFEHLGVVRLQAVCRRSNRKARNLNRRLGFREEGVVRRAYDGKDDAVIYSMMPEEAEKWVGNRT